MTNELIEYYNKKGISISFDTSKLGYWIKTGEFSSFIDERSYKDIQNSNGFEMLKKINACDDMLTFRLSRSENKR